MGVRILEHFELYRDDRFFAAFPDVLAAPDGTVLLSFRRAPDHRWMLGEDGHEELDSVDHVHFRSHIAFMRLGADFKPVDPLKILPVHGEAGDQDANLFLTTSGRLIQYGFLWYPVTAEIADEIEARKLGLSVRKSEHGEAYLYWGGYTRISDDMGRTWSDHQMVPRDDKTYKYNYKHLVGGSALRGRMVELDDGTLIVAGYEGGLKGCAHSAVRALISRDMGESWSVQPDIVSMYDVALMEPAMARWPEGQITIFCRTGFYEDRLVTVTSTDAGRSFGAPETVDVKGHPHDPLVLPDGRLFLVYGYRHDDMGVRARLVRPEEKIEEADELIIRDDSPSGDVGYPAATLLPDGRILIVYYITDKAGVRGIEGTLLAID